MTMHTPDDVARTLEGIAAAQKESVEQVALDSLRSLLFRGCSPEALTSHAGVASSQRRRSR